MSTVSFVCTKCGKDHEVESSDFGTEQECNEGGMGERVEHSTTIEFSCTNAECDNQIVIEINETEYPVGHFEGAEVISSSGAEDIYIK